MKKSRYKGPPQALACDEGYPQPPVPAAAKEAQVGEWWTDGSGGVRGAVRAVDAYSATPLCRAELERGRAAIAAGQGIWGDELIARVREP